MLVLQIMFDIQFGVFFQYLGPMEVASSLMPLDRNLKISRAVDNPYDYPFGLRTIRHEAIEMWLWDSMPNYDMVEVMSKKHLSIFVLKLEVTASNGHDVLVCPVVYVASHGGPLGHSLDMVRHDPNMLEIPTRLHAPNQINPTIGANLERFEDDDFVRLVTLAWT
jgi:hypothetical protein